jgi:hypothetical protein
VAVLAFGGRVLGVWRLRWWGDGVGSVGVGGVMGAAMECVRAECVRRVSAVCVVCVRCERVLRVVVSVCVSTPRVRVCVSFLHSLPCLSRRVTPPRAHACTDGDLGHRRYAPLVDGVLVSWETQAYETRARVRLSSETLGSRL